MKRLGKNPRNFCTVKLHFGETPHILGGQRTIILSAKGWACLRHVSSNEDPNIMETRSASDIEQSTEKLLQDLKEVVRDGEELLRAGAEELGERGAAAKEKLAAALEVARETQHRLQKQAAAGVKAADKYIRHNPYQSIGIAFGAGMLLGLLAMRRK
jgi:ElaB/YqjD/DUF883 family membrane-anchored ribosome-binding protein